MPLQGVVTSLTGATGLIKSEEHGELPFDIKENFSDVEFTAEDINEEVEFSVIEVRSGAWSSGRPLADLWLTSDPSLRVSTAEGGKESHSDPAGEGTASPDLLLRQRGDGVPKLRRRG